MHGLDSMSVPFEFTRTTYMNKSNIHAGKSSNSCKKIRSFISTLRRNETKLELIDQITYDFRKAQVFRNYIISKLCVCSM